MANAGRRLESVGEVGWRSGRRTDLDRLLAGNTVCTARDIIDLIHDVNPTGKEVDRRESARRYAIKRRLQSLLLQRFSDEMQVVPGDREGVVLLRHKYLGLGASHAIVADLDEDARAWVQMHIDLGAVEQAWTPTSRAHPRPRRGHRGEGRDRCAEGSSGASKMVAALDEGRIAQASYDYEAARDAFVRAHALAPEAPAPLAALLDLLVNQLGLDREALEVVEASPSAALQSPTALAAMALAAARLGQRERAEAWGADLGAVQAAEVFRTLAAKAVDTGDLAYAAEAIERARRRLPVDPGRLAVEMALDRARAAAVAEDEARLARLVARGDVTAAELARQIVERHPGSAPARAALKEAATRERRMRQQKLLDQARAATAASSFKQARQALASAREQGAAAAEIAEVERTLVASETRAAQIAHENCLAIVAVQLSSTAPETKAAIATYLGLDRQDREAVRRRCDAEELDWLDELPPGTPATRGEPLAAAVMAARAARELLEAGNLDGSAQAIAAHRTVLGEHGFGCRLLARIAQARQARQQDHALSALDRASAALRARDVAQAKEIVDSIARDDLPPSSHAELNRLTRALASARQVQACLRLVDERLAKQRPILARQLLLRRLSETPDGDERATLESRLAEVDAAIRTVHLGIDVVPPAGYLASDAPEVVSRYWYDRGVDTLLLPGGKTAVLLSAGQAQLTARLIDVDSGEIRRELTWSMMEAMMPRGLGVNDGRVWIADAYFHYAEISCESWLPCRQADLTPNGCPVEEVTGCLAVPAADAVWLGTQQIVPPCIRRLRWIDVARGSELRLQSTDGDVCYVPGSGSLLACFRPDSPNLKLATVRGESAVHIIVPGVAVAVAVAPDGDGYAVLFEGEDEAEPPLQLMVTTAAGRERARLPLPVAYGGSPSLATILPRRLACVSYRHRESGQMRLAYVHEGNAGQLVLGADVAIPGFATIAQDPGASTAVALCKSAGGIRLARLDDMPTVFPAAYDEFDLPLLLRFVDCSPVSEPALDKRFRASRHLYVGPSDPDLTDSKLKKLAEGVDESPRALSAYRLLRRRGLHHRADLLLQYMQRQTAGNVFVAMAVAECEALAGRWVGESLEQGVAAFGRSEHALHVRAIAYLCGGQLDRAIELLAGRATPGECRLDSLLAMARLVRAEQAGEAVSAAELERPSLAALVGAIFAADRAAARGEREEVLRILDRAWIRGVGEAQSMARLADVYLATGKDAPPMVRLRASTLLVDFLGNRFTCTRGNQLWLGDNTWSLPRLEELEENARSWLLELAWKKMGGSC